MHMAGTQNALVLGGTGLVGQYLVPQLIRQGFAVDIVSRGERSAKSGESNVKLIKANLENQNWIELAGIQLEVYDVIYHLAYAVGQNELLNREVTVNSVCQLLERLSRLKDGKKRHFVYVGSMVIFGASPLDNVVTESSRRNVDSRYAENKLAATKFALTPAHGVVSTVLHPTGVYDEKSSRINKYRKLLSANYVPASPRLGMNNIVHADDVANALVLCLRRNLENNSEYIINGQSLLYRDWFSYLEATVEKNCWLKLPEKFRYICRGPVRRFLNSIHICCPIFFSKQIGSALLNKSVYSSDKAFKDFGYTGKKSFQKIISQLPKQKGCHGTT